MMTPGETGGNTIFYLIQPQRGATKIIRSQRRRDAKKSPRYSAGQAPRPPC
jgi:hypothetical protein